jgi:adenosylcobinamide kinase/adenosylcobinamide-phosphate guanylyltransferase
MKKQIILVTGGCRSGKSSHALELARQYAGKDRFFIATCVPEDDEMRDRVARHQKERGEGFTTVECPVDIASEVNRVGADASVVLVDCLTLWTSNLMMEAGSSAESIEARVKALAAIRSSSAAP